MRETNTCEKNKKVYFNDNTVGYAGPAVYRQLWEENQDLAGWICIPGASIDYPVMMTSHEPEYYIHRNKKERLAQPSLSPPQKFPECIPTGLYLRFCIPAISFYLYYLIL
jgi:hypothetical protein